MNEVSRRSCTSRIHYRHTNLEPVACAGHAVFVYQALMISLRALYSFSVLYQFYLVATGEFCRWWRHGTGFMRGSITG